MAMRLAIGSVMILGAAACGSSEPPVGEGTTSPDAVADMADVDPTAIRPFEIDVPDEVLVDLAARLDHTRFPDEVGTDWTYGTDLAYLQELLTYWRESFDWRAQERRLNQFDQYKTRIDGLDIHFIHQRSPEENALPIIITHGWPGSIAEFTKIIGPLTDPVAHGGRAEDAFHVVAPSIPGYGFSDIPREPGMGPEQVADINAQLMARLGYERYGAQGGDWGSIISRLLAFKHASHVVGLHLNFLIAGPPQGVDDPTAGVPAVELARMQERQAAFGEETGYQQIQGTKPQTLGYGLNDSPAGLAAWIVEKPQLVRLQRRPRVDLHTRRAADEHHDLLGDADDHVVNAHVLRVPTYELGDVARAGRSADRRRHLSTGGVFLSAQVGGGAVQPHALDGDASRRALRRARATGADGGRSPGLLSGPEIRGSDCGAGLQPCQGRLYLGSA